MFKFLIFYFNFQFSVNINALSFKSYQKYYVVLIIMFCSVIHKLYYIWIKEYIPVYQIKSNDIIIYSYSSITYWSMTSCLTNKVPNARTCSN